MLAVPGDGEEVGLVGTFGVGLAERKLGNDPGIDCDPARRHMSIERMRQKQPEDGIRSGFEPVGRQVPPLVEEVEQDGNVGVGHGWTASRRREVARLNAGRDGGRPGRGSQSGGGCGIQSSQRGEGLVTNFKPSGVAPELGKVETPAMKLAQIEPQGRVRQV